MNPSLSTFFLTVPLKKTGLGTASIQDCMCWDCFEATGESHGRTKLTAERRSMEMETDNERLTV